MKKVGEIFFVVQVSLRCQRYLTKLAGEIYLWYKYAANSSGASKTSASMTRLSNHFMPSQKRVSPNATHFQAKSSVMNHPPTL